jgi:hypothetical protein
MGLETLAIVGLVVFFVGMGLAFLFAKDWLWDRHEGNLRTRGLVNLERTPEWESQQTLMGIAMIVCAVVVVFVWLAR